MRKILTIFLFLVILVGTFLLLYNGCKKSDETDSYTLTVSLENGVIGTPEAGPHTYSKNEQVAYEYNLEEAYTNLRVTLDGAEVENSGVITITGDHRLNAYADPAANALALTVSVSNGVSGTPAAGTYHYFAGTQIDYNYSLKENYINLTVKLDGEDINNSGTITISDDHILAATATLHYDIQGSWRVEEEYDDGSSFDVSVTFTGDDISGTVVDSDGGTGTYTVTGVQVTFTLEFPIITYEYSGLFINEDTMSGISKRIISGGATISGDWVATRTSDNSSTTTVSQNNKGTYRNQ
jgi:hypothetical protein